MNHGVYTKAVIFIAITLYLFNLCFSIYSCISDYNPTRDLLLAVSISIPVFYLMIRNVIGYKPIIKFYNASTISVVSAFIPLLYVIAFFIRLGFSTFISKTDFNPENSEIVLLGLLSMPVCLLATYLATRLSIVLKSGYIILIFLNVILFIVSFLFSGFISLFSLGKGASLG
jgi:hypothetical protein